MINIPNRHLIEPQLFAMLEGKPKKARELIEPIAVRLPKTTDLESRICDVREVIWDLLVSHKLILTFDRHLQIAA